MDKTPHPHEARPPRRVGSGRRFVVLRTPGFRPDTPYVVEDWIRPRIGVQPGDAQDFSEEAMRGDPQLVTALEAW